MLLCFHSFIDEVRKKTMKWYMAFEELSILRHYSYLSNIDNVEDRVAPITFSELLTLYYKK